MDDPAIRRVWIRRSLLHKHPRITDSEVDAFFDDPKLADGMIELVESLSVGPRTGGSEDAENPQAV
jgi:hypothetical protein